MARRDEEDSEEQELTDEVLAARDAGLSHIAATLQSALADTQPTPGSLNRRHPDWAAFAVKIGRALGCEAETIAALRTAEEDKSTFCLENDFVAPALLAYLRQAGGFNGTAKDLLPHLVETDPDLDDKLSARGLGKRLTSLWPHLEKQFKCTKRTSHNMLVFSFVPKDGGEPSAEPTAPPDYNFFKEAEPEPEPTPEEDAI
jgi:hypothetical protein